MPYYIGSIITGSFATNSMDKNSDIDLHIILNPNETKIIKWIKMVEWREISYVAASYNYFLNNLQQEPSKVNRIRTSAYAKWYIIEDTSDMIQWLIKLAQTNISKPLRMMNEFDKVLHKKALLNLYTKYQEIAEPYKWLLAAKIISYTTELYFYSQWYWYIGTGTRWKIDRLDQNDVFAKQYWYDHALHDKTLLKIGATWRDDNTIKKFVYEFIKQLDIDDIDSNDYEYTI